MRLTSTSCFEVIFLNWGRNIYITGNSGLSKITMFMNLIVYPYMSRFTSNFLFEEMLDNDMNNVFFKPFCAIWTSWSVGLPSKMVVQFKVQKHVRSCLVFVFGISYSFLVKTEMLCSIYCSFVL